MSKQIINNLILGDMHSIDKKSEIIISCAQEIYDDMINSSNVIEISENKLKSKIDERFYYNFEDFPNSGSLDKKLIKDVLLEIDKNIGSKKIYIHCLWGVNRSASLVFIYLVWKKYLSNKSFEDAINNFKKIYPKHSPNLGWKDFLIKNFPYDNL
ncbi:hypothetical protein SLITO_v1c05230 [Spiroplasma litorale]|uniref:Tyrosine specific protein phosphatases domain-containing protein n=1 Tax=Spiroplasma litorale TaxID=216942 RepID=A0A0K1W1V7_9MOLU|nr:dual specificity protein phosphatase family protein [Spiroplasma litorale]AKX34171.1 hypothetical protein SLITO_v1c05230 [Spiroplasma litorale]